MNHDECGFQPTELSALETPTVTDLEQAYQQIEKEIGLKRLTKTWAKLEIFLGLLAGGIGIYLLGYEKDLLMAGSGLMLFVLGGYLALAGHRSHLYQSSNDQLACLLTQLRTKSNETPRQHGG